MGQHTKDMMENEFVGNLLLYPAVKEFSIYVKNWPKLSPWVRCRLTTFLAHSVVHVFREKHTSEFFS